MDDGLSLREFGRQHGVTGEAVRKAIAEGKIPADCVGQRTIGKKGRSWPVIINPARAAEAWKRNRDPNQVRDKAVMAAGARRGWAQRRGEDPPSEEEHAEPAPSGDGGTPPLRAGATLPSITESKAITEAYKARTAKLEYEQLSGKLVDAAKTKLGFVSMVTAARNRLMGVPSKAKARIPTLTVRDVEILEDLIAEALEEVAIGAG